LISIYLDAVIIAIRDIDVARSIGCNANIGTQCKRVKLFVGIYPYSPCAEEVAIVVEFLDAVMISIRDIDVAIRIGGYVMRIVELPAGGCADSPLAQDVAVAVEFLDAVIIAINDIGISCRISRYALGIF